MFALANSTRHRRPRCGVLPILAFSLVALAFPVAVRAAGDLPAEVQSYQAALDKLDVKDAAQVPKAVETYRATFAKSSEAVCDAGFLLFRTYWGRVRELQSEACRLAQEAAEKKHPKMKFGEFQELMTRDMAELSSTTLYVQGGLRAYPDTEGTFFVAERPGFFLSSFGSMVSPGIREFLELEAAETGRPWAREGEVVISWQELGERVAGWDKYLAKHEKSPMRTGAQTYYRTVARAFLVGLPQSPLWDYETHEVRPEVRAAFERYAKDNAKLASGKAVAEEYAIFKKHNFKMDDDGLDEMAVLLVRLGLK